MIRVYEKFGEKRLVAEFIGSLEKVREYFNEQYYVYR